MRTKFDERRPKVGVLVSTTAGTLVKEFAYVDQAARYVARNPARYVVQYVDPLTEQAVHVSGEDFQRLARNFPRTRTELDARRNRLPWNEAHHG